jgi:hypothetical protein
MAPVRRPNENNRPGGRLRASIGNRVTSRGFKVLGRVGSSVRYALVVHTGAAPHVILPRRKKALAFKWKKAYPHLVTRSGKWKGYVMLPIVHHPGMKGTEYLTTPLIKYGRQMGFKVIITPRGV